MEAPAVPRNALVVLPELLQAGGDRNLLDGVVAVEPFSILPVQRPALVVLIEDDLPAAVE